MIKQFKTYWFFAAILVFAMPRISDAAELSFSRDVLPILSDRCFHCHGPDENNREAELRLDTEEGAKEDRGGYSAVTPNDIKTSELWARITSTDPDTVMPPAGSHRKPLNERERNAIRQWIESGAKWGKHWSFERPIRPEVPPIADHPVDAFVRERLQEHDLTLSAPASTATQLRRLSFDLTGISPSVADVEAFTAEPTDEAWSGQIDKVFASPHYAERMAMWWLDAARYSDSDGFQQDKTRQNWPWRDWVIEQFRTNRPFDEFTIEQFAGDLLPNATDEQKLATCFHRNHMTNGEGGRDPEESRIDYVIDRVNTTGTVWLGLTLGCVQCHSHKFDPVSHHDYYSMFAFFDSIDEDGRAGTGAKPYLKFTSPFGKDSVEQQAAFLETCRKQEVDQKRQAEERFDDWLNAFAANLPAHYQPWHVPAPQVSSSDGTEFVVNSDQIVQTTGRTPRQDDYRIAVSVPSHLKSVTGWKLEVFPHADHRGGRFTRDGNGEFTLTNVRILGRRNNSPTEVQLEMSGAKADAERSSKHKEEWDPRFGRVRDTLNDDARDGWSTIGIDEVKPHVAVFELSSPWTVHPDDQLIIVLRHRSTHGFANIGRFRISLSGERGETVRRVDGGSPIAELVDALHTSNSPNDIPTDLRKRLLSQYLIGDDTYQAAARRVRTATGQLNELRSNLKARNVMVLAQRKEPRKSHVLVRGVWDAKGDVVEPAVLPSVLKRSPERTRTRLDLANWLVDPENPLTARVTVNHLWQMMFGNGLVRTPNDFGLQGELPTHPKLLDWLAVELVEHDWDIQHILKLIATSQTYRQSSASSAALQELDPENRLLARAPRFRLPAWMIRDNALAISGLLNRTTYGPPVRPWQPAGVWGEITMGRFKYEPSLGPAQYRRTVYGFWRRSIAPTFLFDSAQRRVCEVGVRRTNTPLHALTLLNDVTMLEASRALADIALETTFDNSDINETIHDLAHRILSRPLTAAEQTTVRTVFNQAFEHYGSHPTESSQYTTVGQQAPPAADKSRRTAAWMTVASMLLNLDEAMTRE